MGIHCISDPYKYYFIVRDLSIGAGMTADTPSGVTDLQLTPEATGLLALSGKFTLPVADVTGNSLAGDVTVKVSRGDILIATLSGAPGATLTFEDNDIPEKGTYSYTVTTTADGADGVAVSASAFVGPYPAAVPASISAVETATPGTVSFSWEAVDKDINDTQLEAANVTYMIYKVEAKSLFNTVVTPLLDAPIAATSATVKVAEADAEQKFIQFAVAAFNRGEKGEDKAGEMIAVGKPYEIPVTYSGTASQDSYITRISNAGTGFWEIYTPSQLTNAPAPVATDDYYGCYAGAAELYGDLYTGKIDLSAAERPEVSFYTYKFPANHDYFVGEDVNFIEVIAVADGQMELVGTAAHSSMQEGRWNKVRMDLSAYKGKSIQLMFRGVAKTGNYTLLDEVNIKETPAYDLEALYMDAPAECAIATPFGITLKLANQGYMDATTFTVKLLRDGLLVEERSVDALAAGEQLSLSFEQQITYFDTDNTGATYSAEIVAENDDLPDNNLFAETRVTRPVSSLPTVADLRGDADENGNKLYWTVYTVDDLEPAEMTEDFENASPWTYEFEGWTFVSESESACDNIYGYSFPGITPYASQFAYVVINNLGVESALPSVSGNQYIASLCKADHEANNDWAISPLLCGDAQTISFWAKGVSFYYAEKFEVYYTTVENPAISDFVQLTEEPVTAPTYEWGKYEYQLPEGTMHFAVRCVSANAYFLMLDDFTFTPDPLAGAPTLVGYDVYRDGVKLNAEPVSEGEYLDAKPGTNHTYHVVALYDKGHSELSNPLELENNDVPQSGINGVASSSIRVYAAGHSIVVEGADQLPVAVYSIDGRTIHQATGNCRVAVAPAVYIVTAGQTTYKLAVK